MYCDHNKVYPSYLGPEFHELLSSQFTMKDEQTAEKKLYKLLSGPALCTVRITASYLGPEFHELLSSQFTMKDEQTMER